MQPSVEHLARCLVVWVQLFQALRAALRTFPVVLPLSLKVDGQNWSCCLKAHQYIHSQQAVQQAAILHLFHLAEAEEVHRNQPISSFKLMVRRSGLLLVYPLLKAQELYQVIEVISR